jgi:hypothetical protein
VLYSDKSKYAKHILKSDYGLGNVIDSMNTLKIIRKQQILEIYDKTVHVKIMRKKEETQKT